MLRPNKQTKKNGFTVLEILLGLVIFSFIAAIVYNMFAMGIKLDGKTRRVHQWANETRLAFDVLSRELENAFIIDVSGIDNEKSSFGGSSDRIGFLIPTDRGIDAVEYYLGMPNFGTRQRVLIGRGMQAGKNIVTKSVQSNTEQFLIRRRIPWLSFMKNTDDGVEEQVIVPGIAAHGLRIRYSDGYQDSTLLDNKSKEMHWLDQWDSDALPIAVLIEMTFANGVTVTREIVLPVAAASISPMVNSLNKDVTRHTVNVRYLDSIKDIKQ